MKMVFNTPFHSNGYRLDVGNANASGLNCNNWNDDEHANSNVGGLA
jgi:hypothetical protein